MPTKNSHGGARTGAGRNAKEGPPKKQLPVKVDQFCIEKLKDLSESTGVSQAKITQWAIMRLDANSIIEAFKKKS